MVLPRLKLAADALQKVRDAEPEVDCGWSWGVGGKYWLFPEVGTWFIHTNMMPMYQWSFYGVLTRGCFLRVVSIYDSRRKIWLYVLYIP